MDGDFDLNTPTSNHHSNQIIDESFLSENEDVDVVASDLLQIRRRRANTHTVGVSQIKKSSHRSIPFFFSHHFRDSFNFHRKKIDAKYREGLYGGGIEDSLRLYHSRRTEITSQNNISNESSHK